MRRLRLVLLASILSCSREAQPAATAPPTTSPLPAPGASTTPEAEAFPEIPNFGPMDASEPGGQVLIAGRRIAYVERRIFTAGCWDFVNAVFDDAGYPQNQRHTVFGGRRTGPYANVNLLKPGDWVMHLRAEAGGGEHSAIFVRWESRPSKIARMLDYVGDGRPATGHLSRKALSRIFTIVRAGKKTK